MQAGAALIAGRLRPCVVAAVLLALAVGAPPTWGEVSQEQQLRVSFNGRISPSSLPHDHLAPITIALSSSIKALDDRPPPQLEALSVAINRHGRLDYRGLPACRLPDIQPASTSEAFRACRRSLVGTGVFKANVVLPDQSPFPSNGRILLFNGKVKGAPVIFAHIFGEKPLPTSFTLPFAIRKSRKGAYGTVLVARLPQIAADWGYVSGVALKLGHRFKRAGSPRSYISASCPALRGFGGATFPFARAVFEFEGSTKMVSTLTRSCRVRQERPRA